MHEVRMQRILSGVRGYLRSEYELQAKLNDARLGISRRYIWSFTNGAECGAVEVDIRQAEIRAVRR